MGQVGTTSLSTTELYLMDTFMLKKRYHGKDLRWIDYSFGLYSSIDAIFR